ncbi:MAG: UDP-2,3-diacylglucosamine diphosphatase [Gammaproteobacteria bacterium]|nr:UDP-2,3-diacylglucosamine diphosphatase [Gammaproteobacteria bacterium]
MTTLLLSDLHLDDARPAATQRFTDLLSAWRGRTSALYILGDLVEYWLGDDQDVGDLETAFRTIRDFAATCPVYFMHGNRDFLIGNGFASRYGVELIEDPTVVDLHGTPTLLMHGDTLCTDDHDYQALRGTVRDPDWQRVFLSKSLAEREAMARRLRDTSKAAMAEKSREIMDVNAHSVAQAFRKHGVGRLIHGHVHRPAVHAVQIGDLPGERIVMGDWYESSSYVTCDREGCTLHQ